MSIDEAKLHELLGTAVTDFGATFHAALVVIGDRLGLYRALADGGPLTSTELAERTETAERYVREWLRSQAAGGYVTYDPETDRYDLTPEQAAALADESSPAFVAGGFESAVATLRSTEAIEEAFRTGDGVGWHEHDTGLFKGTERFFKPSYATHLIDEWIPALDGVDEKLEAGARVADVGCGHGASTILMAQAYPESTFVGVDYHDGSIETARERAKEANLSDRVRFEVAEAKTYNGTTYDFVAMFDCLHDMGDPVGVAAHVAETLDEDGTWMIVEPYASDDVEENLNPLGRAFYSASTMLCTPNAISQEGEHTLGAQAGEARIREVVTAGGLSRFRRATETPFNLVFEARP
ncbi:methyltransferase domain-containing protein [Haladaptatus sp. NG-SE-30]